MVSNFEIDEWKRNADSGDAESAFLIYITHTDPGTGAPQDWETAWYYLNIAFEQNHPDAVLTMGTLYITGERLKKDITKGKMLILKAKELGCQQVDMVTQMLGIDIDNFNVENVNYSPSPDNLRKAIINKLKSLKDEGTINLSQENSILKIIYEEDVEHLVNINGILSNPNERKKLASNAEEITGWDSRNFTFYVKNKRKGFLVCFNLYNFGNNI